MKKENLIIIINTCTKIMDIFLGPFLVAYFIKTSADSMVDLSIFKILNYFFLAAIGLFAGFLVEKGHPLATFRVGIITRFIYILTIVLLGENIVNYLSVVSFLYGFSTITFFIPFNLYRADCVKNKNRALFEVKMKTASSLICILTPLFLGTLITTTNYQITAIVILIVSAIQIASSFYLKPLPDSDCCYDIKESFKTFIKNPQINKVLRADFFNGLTISDGAISVLITILIMESFQTDMNLGIINSVAAILTLIATYIYSKYYQGKNDNKLVVVSSILPVIAVLLLCFYPSSATIVIYNFIFEIFAMGLLSFVFQLRLLNLSQTTIDDSQKTEYWVIRELILNTGRITGYILMLLVGILGIQYLNFSLIILSLCLLIFGYQITKVNKNDN